MSRLFGFKHSLQTREKMCQTRRERQIAKLLWQNPEYREKQIKARLGKRYSPLTEFKKGHISWAVLNRGKYKINMTPSAMWARQNPIKRQQMRDSRLRQIFPIKDTAPELAMQEFLRLNNIEFKTHIPVEGVCQTDIFIEPNVCIFVDGCWWHCCPIHFSNVKLSKGQRWNLHVDKHINETLSKAGYDVYRIWAHDVCRLWLLCLGMSKV